PLHSRQSLRRRKETTPVASATDWPSRVPVARQPSSGVWGPADRQLLMKPGRRVEGARCREGAIRPPFSCLTRPGMRLHTSFLGFKHPPTGARVSCLKAIIGSPHLVHHHPPPHHP
ncbi:30S ribosomal protein S8 chloroplastic, partial [Dissostichus eleginoides]